MNLILKIDTQPTIMTKAKAESVADANNGGDDIYVVRLFNEKQNTYVVDVVENGEVVFTI
jgi:hypothetical protein